MAKTQVQIEKIACVGNSPLGIYLQASKFEKQGYKVEPFTFSKISNVFIDHNKKLIYGI